MPGTLVDPPGNRTNQLRGHLSPTGRSARRHWRFESGTVLRGEFNRRGNCELSSADAFHLAMAVAVPECDALYPGDPGLAAVDEIETVVP